MNSAVIQILEFLIENHRELEHLVIDKELRYAIDLLEQGVSSDTEED